MSNTFSHRLLQQEPNRMAGGTVRTVDSTSFPASKTIAAALVELVPVACASCTGIRTRTSGNTTSKAKAA
jgi:hypothetical protein